jgi:phosphoribosylglycinamide formyltransferase 2
MNVTIGTPFKSSAVKVLLCGSGELGKEVVLELQRYGVEVIAADAYANAPAMQVADRSHVLSMLDGDALRKVIDTLAELEKEGVATIIPTARATQLTMNREGIRRLAAEELELTTSPFQFAETEEEFNAAVAEIGLPCVVKPIMSSSG